MNSLIVSAMLLFGGADLTNSHRVAPLSQKIVKEAPKLTHTWEVGLVGGVKVTVEATKMLDDKGMLIFANDEDEITMVVNKTQLLYAKKIKKESP